MFKKGTKAYSVINFKCPKCQEADFFTHRFTFNPVKIGKVHNTCPKCGFKHMIEPSFFFGAMYVSYALFVAIAVALFIITKVFIGLSLLQSFISIIVLLLLLGPFLVKLSRIIWSNMFVDYEEQS
ncbi:DUF983 domain-containing protein [Tenacibaculum sp. MEBiC06402]|uniref:DUF983 domain-containing protein n=1 Tax=unclassified Tenacibaculum TaxID=2635139 RepID=UPI003B9C60DE